MEDIYDIKFWAQIVAVVTGVILFLKGLAEYKNNLRIKRAEFLEKLIGDFNDKSSEIAKYMLDDYQYIDEEYRQLPFEEQQKHIKPLYVHLKDHRLEPVTGMDEVKVRRSFDQLLDFFTRLSYYLKQELISPAELFYFRYYIDKVEENKAVRKYIQAYFYEEDFLRVFSERHKSA